MLFQTQRSYYFDCSQQATDFLKKDYQKEQNRRNLFSLRAQEQRREEMQCTHL